MAQHMYEYGGQQGIPFLQQQFPGFNWPNTFADTSADNFTSQQSILDQSDNAFMTDFWTDPDGARPVNHSFPWPGMDNQMNRGNTGGQLGGFEGESQTVHNPAMSLPGNSASQYQSHTNGQLGQMASHMNFGGDANGQGSEDDIKAASGLFNMSMHGQENSRALPLAEGGMTNAFAGYDDNAGFNNVHMQDNTITPMTSSGRQSANSHHGQHATPLMTNPSQAGLTQEQLQHQFWMNYQQQQMGRNVPRARHQSLQLETSSFNFMPGNQQMQMTQPATAYNQATTRPPLMRFGSDNNFSHTGYHGPLSNMAIEQEKEGNLVNVPFAAQVAANGFQQVHSRGPHMGPQGLYAPTQYSMRNNPAPIQTMSAASSPGARMGGLPLTSPTYGAQRPGHSFRPIMHQQVGDEESPQSEAVSDFEEELPRKRRKSQMGRENEGNYTASSHVKVTVPKRDPKPSKNVSTPDSDDDYVTPVKVTASKRRKSSMADARPALVSGDSSSPAAIASPAPKQTPASGTKKKGGRANEPRQNLTEDQKRRNHIQSEKQRRDLIKIQYDELDILVPALKGGKSGLSRSDVLHEIVSHVQNMQAGNAAMEALLDSMPQVDVAASPADEESDA